MILPSVLVCPTSVMFLPSMKMTRAIYGLEIIMENYGDILGRHLNLYRLLQNWVTRNSIVCYRNFMMRYIVFTKIKREISGLEILVGCTILLLEQGNLGQQMK